MIDDYEQAMELLREMEAQLPIPARPTAMIRALRGQRHNISRDTQLLIVDVSYAGDEGGIVCALEPGKNAEAVLVVSITHLEIDPHHPLAKTVRIYQQERTKRLARSGGPRRPPPFTVHPRKKRKRRR